MILEQEQELEFSPLQKLTRDLKNASKTLSKDEARFLVDGYYALQKYRISTANQLRALKESGEPHEVTEWLMAQTKGLESNIRRALDTWTDTQAVGIWAKSITGIGPVISAGLLAHIDISKAPTVGHIWRFAGLDPTVTWEKGKKRPWNAELKTLCWKMGECFVKVSGFQSDYYGKLYLAAKEKEIARNASGELAEQAAAKLEKFKIGKNTAAYAHYAEGRLPPAHIHRRATRKAVKLFLSHLHTVWFESTYHMTPPKPWVIEHGGHAHLISPPNWKDMQFVAPAKRNKVDKVETFSDEFLAEMPAPEE